MVETRSYSNQLIYGQIPKFWVAAVLFFLGGRRGMRTPKHFVNLTGESKNFKMLAFPLNQLL
jgi:hypothetical protein